MLLTHDPSTLPTTSELSELLRRSGLHALLGALNARTRYRFTGVYRFDPPWLRGECLFDRENPALHLTQDALMAETYCALVEREERPLVVEDGAADARVHDHAAVRAHLAYMGVGLVDARGRCVGTICHFDPRPRVLAPRELELLRAAAPLVVDALGR